MLPHDGRQRLPDPGRRRRHRGAGAVHPEPAHADRGDREDPLELCTQAGAIQDGAAAAGSARGRAATGHPRGGPGGGAARYTASERGTSESTNSLMDTCMRSKKVGGVLSLGWPSAPRGGEASRPQRRDSSTKRARSSGGVASPRRSSSPSSAPPVQRPPRPHRRRLQRRTQTQRPQHRRAIGRHLQPRPHFADGIRLLQHRHRCPAQRQGLRHGKPRHPRAQNRYRPPDQAHPNPLKFLRKRKTPDHRPGVTVHPARAPRKARRRDQSSRCTFSRRSCFSCASSVIVAMGRASSRFRLIGSPVISQ